MIVASKEAKMKWCPMGRSSDSQVGGSINDPVQLNGPIGGDFASNCIAESCMMWRRHALGIDAGFCGLAGKPEVMIR